MKIIYLKDYPEFRETIAAWLMQEWGSRYPERTLDIWKDTQTYLGKESLPLTLIAIDEKTEDLIGTVCLREDGMTTHPDWKAWLSYLVVPPSYRGKGIAKTLLKAAEEVAFRLDIKILHLFTRLETPSLYTAAGWVIIGREQYRGGMATVMKKNMDSNHIVSNDLSTSLNEPA